MVVVFVVVGFYAQALGLDLRFVLSRRYLYSSVGARDSVVAVEYYALQCNRLLLWRAISLAHLWRRSLYKLLGRS
jgi:hypothetical protein